MLLACDLHSETCFDHESLFVCMHVHVCGAMQKKCSTKRMIVINFYLYICKDLTNILSEAYMLFIMLITFIQLEIF